MKQGGELKRKTPLARGTVPMKHGAPLVAKKPMARATTPMKSRSKTNSTPRPRTGEAELCRGHPCYLLVPGVHAHPLDTVVPCHSNQQKHGKGKGIKAHDKYTVPGCMYCHAEIDQGNRFTRQEKFDLWDAAYARWAPVRDAMR